MIPRTFFAYIAWSVSALALVSCATTPEERDASARTSLKREVDDEVAVGRAMAAKLLGHFGYVDNKPAASAYVALVGETLAQAAGRTELMFHFAVLKTDEVNAFATPGGYIFVTLGLLKELRSEAELAGVLGHEIAHVNEKHMYAEIMPKREVSASESVVRLMSRGRSDIGGSFSKIVNSGLKMLLEDGIGKDKEYAADQAGALYAQQAGYNPTALLSVIRRLEQDASTVKVSKTHPPFAERINGFERFLNTNGLVNGSKADETVMKERFEKALGGL